MRTIKQIYNLIQVGMEYYTALPGFGKEVFHFRIAGKEGGTCSVQILHSGTWEYMMVVRDIVDYRMLEKHLLGPETNTERLSSGVLKVLQDAIRTDEQETVDSLNQRINSLSKEELWELFVRRTRNAFLLHEAHEQIFGESL